MEESLMDYLLAIVQATRHSDLLSLGSQHAWSAGVEQSGQGAWLSCADATYCLPDDIKELAPIILSHRVMLNPTHGMRTTELRTGGAHHPRHSRQRPSPPVIAPSVPESYAIHRRREWHAETVHSSACCSMLSRHVSGGWPETAPFD